MTEFVHDQMVTVTITHDEQTHVVDGFITRTDMCVHTNMSHSYGEHIAVDPSLPVTHRQWLIVDSPSESADHFVGIPRVGPDHSIHRHRLWVCSTGETVSVTDADEAARARVEKVLSPRRVVDSMVARIAAQDPAAAERLRSAVDDLIDAAFDRGVGAEADRA